MRGAGDQILAAEALAQPFQLHALPGGDVGLQFLLELVELEVDLLGRPALLVDGGDAFLLPLPLSILGE